MDCTVDYAVISKEGNRRVCAVRNIVNEGEKKRRHKDSTPGEEQMPDVLDSAVNVTVLGAISKGDSER